MKHVTSRHMFHEVVFFLTDDIAAFLLKSYQEYLDRTRRSSGFTATDEVSGEQVVLNFVNVQSLHVNDVSSLSEEQLTNLRESLKAPVQGS